MNPTRRTQAIRIGRRVYLVALAIAVTVLFINKRADIVALFIDARLPQLLATLVSSFGLIWLGAKFWNLSLQMLGHPVPLCEVVIATTRALPARYMPMGAGLAIGRVALLRTTGVRSGPLVATAALEMTISVAVAFTVGTSVLGTVDILPGGVIWTVAGLALAAIGASPMASRALSRIVTRRGISLTITWGTWIQLTTATSAYWIWNSVTFVLYLRAFPAADNFGVLEIAGAFMTAWAVGFLAVLAPQGIGVAEMGLVTLLAADENNSIALAAIFGGYRLVQMVRDAVASVTGEIIATVRVRQGSAQKETHEICGPDGGTAAGHQETIQPQTGRNDSAPRSRPNHLHDRYDRATTE